MNREIFIRVVIGLYRLCLHLYPRHFQEEFAEEMVTIFQEQLEATAANGRLALLTLLLHELGGLAAGSVRQWHYAWRARPVLAQAGGGVIALAERGWPWRSILIGMGLGLLLLFLAWWIYMLFFFSFAQPPRAQEIALGDLTGNGQLDAYLANAPDGEPYIYSDYLLLNEGNGRFRDSGQNFSEMSRFSVKLGDVNGDGNLDIVVGQGLGVTVYLANDQNLFYSGGSLSGSEGTFRSSLALADLNNDGSLDIFSANCCGGAIVSPKFQPLFSSNLVWLNNGVGRFHTNGQQLAQTGNNAVALGDLNGDGFVDAFIAAGQSTNPDGDTSNETPNTVWLNDGQGIFRDSGQRLGEQESMAVALGDVNGDGFLDAVVGNRGADEIWLNDGRGNFRDSGQQLGGGLTRSVFLADLNGDSHLDVVAGEETKGRIWLNDGLGQFERGQGIGYGRYEAIALGDVTGDGVLDIFVAGVETYEVWRGSGNGRFISNGRFSHR